MLFYRLGIEEGRRKKYAWAFPPFETDDILVECEICGRKWNDDVYIQLCENILDYNLIYATKIRNFLLPLFPPKEDKQFPIYSSVDDMIKARQSGIEKFMLEEDLL